jgi:hypothetical protein
MTKTGIIKRQSVTVGSSLGAAVLGVVCSAVGLGCESQAAPSYRGEPLLSVTGQVEAALSVGQAEVGILWLTTSGDLALVCTGEVETASGGPSECVDACGTPTCINLEAWDACIESCSDVQSVFVQSRLADGVFINGGIGQTTPVVGEFPAQFSLDILEPPPAEALIGSATGERVAVGLFVAVDPAGAPWHLDDLSHLPAWLLGGSESHILLFSPDGFSESSVWATAFSFTMAPGYQLVAQLPGPPEDPESTSLVPVPAGDAQQVRLRIAPPDTIAWPLL